MDEPRTLTVRDLLDGYQRIPVPAGFSDLAFRNAVATASTLYNTQGKLPSVDDLHKAWPRIPKATYAAIVVTKEFKQAMLYRGVDWDDKAGLSLEQNHALLLLSDPSDRRTTGAKLKQLGIPYARYQAWMRQPLFANVLRQQSENVLADAVPAMLNKLVGNIEAGDNQSIKLGLEISGRYNPAQQQVEDAKAIVQRVVEAVIRRVHDPEVRMAILTDIREAALVVGIEKSLED